MGMSLEEIDQKLRELTSSVDEILSRVEPMEKEVAEISLLEDEITQEYNKRISEIREERYQKRKQIMEITSEASNLKTAMQMLEAQRADALKEIAAKQRLQELYDKIADVFEKAPWAETIKDYQKEDVLSFFKAYKDGEQGALNANVMGAGKTLETTAFITAFRDDFRKEYNREPHIIWLTRKSLVKSTAAEILRWDDSIRFAPLLGTKEMRQSMLDIAIQANIPIITNYETTNSMDTVREFEWDLIVMDECHKIKGGEAVKLFHHTRDMAHKAKFFLGLSGSPIQNKPEDIWAIFHILDPYRFPDVRRFSREFTTEVFNTKTGVWENKVNEQRLLNVMQGKVIKQDPKIIQGSWPEKRRIFKVLEMAELQRAAYDKIKGGVIAYFEKKAIDEPDKSISITAIIAQLTYLRQANVWPAGITVKSPDGDEVYNVDVQESSKIEEAETLIDELIGEGEQVVVWCNFNEPLFELERRVKEAGHTVALMYGGTKDPRAIESLFQDGSIDVLLCQRAAVSEGFNFQKSDRWPGGSANAIFLDQWWNPKANEQAEDRIWRTGANQPVTIYYLLNDDSVDAFIAAKLEAKEQMIDGIMNSEMLRPAEVLSMLEDLL